MNSKNLLYTEEVNTHFFYLMVGINKYLLKKYSSIFIIKFSIFLQDLCNTFNVNTSSIKTEKSNSSTTGLRYCHKKNEIVKFNADNKYSTYKYKYIYTMIEYL